MSWKTRIAATAILLLAVIGEVAQPQKMDALNVWLHLPKTSEALAITPPTSQMAVDDRLIEANTKFGFKLFNSLRKQEPNKNIFISPTSVAIALSMTYNGASGETKQEMAKTLELLGMTSTDINKANQSLQKSLETADPDVKLSMANSLWARQNFIFKPEFIQTNQQFYQAQVTSLDFANPQSPRLINNWVSQKTQGKINQIVEEINADQVLFLINAIYFKGNWTTSFDASRTANKPFYLEEGGSKPHPMMSQQGFYRYYENDRFQAVSLPYGKEGRLSMYLFLPNSQSSLADFSNQLTPENWNQWMQGFRGRDGHIEVPRFKLEYEVELNKTLKALGMEAVFDRSKADFSQMTSDQVFVDAVKHKTFVEVNEAGTEAAAVTSVGIRATSLPLAPFQMTIDRPFFCVIRDNQTGTVLFMGSIVDPK